MANRTKVFISYSHDDEDWLKRLRDHLRPLERERADDIDFWDDRKIGPGSNWREEIEQAISHAKVAVLLVTASFLASDFIATDELPLLLDAAEKEGAKILPVIISASRFLRTTNLSRFQAVNDPSVPIINLPRGEQEAILEKVAEAIEAAIEPSPKTHLLSSERKDSQRETVAPSDGKERSQLDLGPGHKKYGYALIIGTIVFLAVLAGLLVRMKSSALPAVLIVLGAIVVIFIWIPFRISVNWLSLAPPRQLRYRLLVFSLGVLILAAGVYLYGAILKEPTLRSYVAYITLDPEPTATNPANCRATFHVFLRLEVPEGQEAVYYDRIKAFGGGPSVDSNPSAKVLNSDQVKQDPHVLDFRIPDKTQWGSSLDAEVVALAQINITPDQLKVGPHLPYHTDYVFVVIDYSRLKFPAPSDIRGELELPGPGKERQTEPLAVIHHPVKDDKTATLVAHNVPANSDILLRWGAK
ncbi:MAG: hypothetical protein QOE96_1878 [Blastocatellia bacterium]|jgi:hypothetical protein|nr:hypothetical protein [Blastocatellia bacterium]